MWTDRRYLSHLTMNSRLVSDPLDVEGKSHVLSIIFLIDLMSDVCSSSSPRLLAKAFDRLTKGILNASIAFTLVESSPVDCLRTATWEEFIKNCIEHYGSYSNTKEDDSQVASSLRRFFNSLSQWFCFPDILPALWFWNRSIIIWCLSCRLSGTDRWHLSQQA